MVKLAMAGPDVVRPVEVFLPDGTPMTVKTLLSDCDANPKLAKGLRYGYRTAGLALAPARSSGYQTCPHATDGCRSSCLYTSGVGGLFPSVPRWRVAKTLAYFRHRGWFLARLDRELGRFARRARRDGLKPVARLNVFSDLPWEKLAPDLFRHRLHLMDYTKSFERMSRFLDGGLPPNYHLTFSRSEANEDRCKEVLARGGTVAVVFGMTPRQWQEDRPKSLWGFPVVDGERHDLRFLDPPGTVVGLVAKGKGRKDTSGFVLKEWS